MLSDNLNSYYMKKLIVVAVSAGIFAYLNSESRSDDLFPANVEALAEFESTITCDSGQGYRRIIATVTRQAGFKTGC